MTNVINLERRKGLMTDRKTRELVDLVKAINGRNKDSLEAQNMIRRAQKLVTWLETYKPRYKQVMHRP